MPLHDWTLVSADTFHDVHHNWTGQLRNGLNGGVLPPGFYARSEQHFGRKIPDLLTLHTSDPLVLRNVPEPVDSGTVAVATAPPRVSRQIVLNPSLHSLRRTVTVRHTNTHRIVALVEILSPSNKASAGAVAEFVSKIRDALYNRIHVVLLDLLPPGRHNPCGLHGAIMEACGSECDPAPEELPLTFASFCASEPPVAYLDHLKVGQSLPETPLFLTADRYVPLPLEATSMVAVNGMGSFWLEVLEGQRPAPGS